MKQLSTASAYLSFTLVMLVATATLLFTGCGGSKKDPNKDYAEITADNITCIRASKAISVRFKQDKGTPKITVITKKALTSSVDVHMEGSILVATIKDGKTIPESGVEVIVIAPSVNEIDADMTAVVNLGEELNLTGDMKIKTNHAANVKCKRLSCNNLFIESTNAGVVQLSSITANNLTARATNSATIMLDGKAANSTIQKGDKTVVYAEKLETKNGHVETVQNTPLPAIKKIPGTQTASKPAAADTTKAAQKPAQTAAQKPAQTAAQKPTQAPAQKPTQTPAQTPAQNPAQKPAQTSAQKPAQTPAQKPTQKPAQ